MKNKIKAVAPQSKPDEIVGHFGKTQLIREPAGNLVLVGGTKKEQSIVRNWCKQCAPFIVFETKGQSRGVTH